jgi:glycerol kinase
MQNAHEKKAVLALDAGTTAVKAFAFDADEKVVAAHRVALEKNLSSGGERVEQDPQGILAAARGALKTVADEAKSRGFLIVAAGITNQRETVVLWDRETGEALHPAVVWEDERTAGVCADLQKKAGVRVREKTGLPIIPYFSATKIAWLLDHAPSARRRGERGELCAGTVDSWILWNLSEEHVFRTDVTNASRTLLFNIRDLRFDEELLDTFRVPRDVLAEVRPSRDFFGTLRSDIAGVAAPIAAVAGDQQAGLFAAGDTSGTTKLTAGTGTFLMQVLGGECRIIEPFFTTLAASTAATPLYALEAKVGRHGAAAQDILSSRGSWASLLESIAVQSNGYIGKLPIKPSRIVVDGGIVSAPGFCAALEKISGIPMSQQALSDATALGIARLALGGTQKPPD